jgi:hypothetical protein
MDDEAARKAAWEAWRATPPGSHFNDALQIAIDAYLVELRKTHALLRRDWLEEKLAKLIAEAGTEVSSDSVGFEAGWKEPRWKYYIKHAKLTIESLIEDEGKADG